MKKQFLFFIFMVLAGIVIKAQTWNGSAGTDWNTAANWTPAIVPIATGNVIIPNTANKPILANNVTINNFSMSLGSGLDFNGFTLTSNAIFDINGATLNNSNGATDISITLNGTNLQYLRQSVINDNIIINPNGTSDFREGYQFPNTFNGNATFNIAGTGTFYSSFDNASTYNGNVTVNRTVAGLSEIFRFGAVAVTGNFSYTNNAGGNTLIHQLGTIKVPITGTVNITTLGGSNPIFSMERIQNSTTGGTISVQNSGFVTIAYDTLLLSALNVNGYTGGNIDDFLQNQITGTVNISDAATNTNPHYFRKNTINGNTTITINSAADFREGYQGPNTFNGNASFNIAGTGTFYSSFDNASTYNGNVTVNRTVAGLSEIFRFGAVAVTGNFSYTNNAGGTTMIHALGPSTTTTISGTVNITATGAGNPTFSMERIQNNTTGGTISVQNSGFVTIAYDTLLLSALNVNGYTGGNIDDFLQNQITGTVNISDAATNSNNHYFRGNTINGNTTITVNSAPGFYESYQYSSTYNGNLTVNRNNGNVFLAYDNPSNYNQNLTINSSSGISFANLVRFGGNTNGVIEQTGTQPIIFPQMQMQKTGAGNLILNDSVTVGTNLSFSGGNIISSTVNPLIFLDNATYTTASNTSHVNGPVAKTGNDAFVFPAGSATSLNTVAITAPAVATDKFSAQYFLASPTLVGDTSQKDPALKKISNCEYWDVKRLIGTSATTLTFSFAAPCAGGTTYINNPASARITRWTGSTWENLGNGGSTGTTTGTVTTAAAVNNFSPFTFASVDLLAAPLPLTLRSFNAVKCNSNVCIEFATENEINFNHFEIEKSSNGSNFTAIKIVVSNGSSAVANYSTTDNQPFAGINYYRLKLVDKNNMFTYSHIAKVDFSKKYTITILPNPAKEYIIINGANAFKQIQIINADGKVVKQMNKANDNRYNLSGLSKGFYLVRLIGTEETTTTKLIIEQ